MHTNWFVSIMIMVLLAAAGFIMLSAAKRDGAAPRLHAAGEMAVVLVASVGLRVVSLAGKIGLIAVELVCSHLLAGIFLKLFARAVPCCTIVCILILIVASVPPEFIPELVKVIITGLLAHVVYHLLVRILRKDQAVSDSGHGVRNEASDNSEQS